MLLVEDTRERVRVSGFSKGLHAGEVPVGTSVTLYTDSDGHEYNLVFPQSLYLGDKVVGSLLNPNQMRHHGLVVEDCPTQFDNNSSHSIYVPKPADLRIPLTLRGVMSGFMSRKPTKQEWESADIPRIEMTSDRPWDPGSDDFAQIEERKISGVTRQGLEERLYLIGRSISAVRSLRTANDHVVAALEDEGHDLYDRLIAQVRVSPGDLEGDGLQGYDDREVYAACQEASAIETAERGSILSPQVLSRRWSIGLKAATDTLNVTTQSGIRNVLGPSERKLRQRTDYLRYPVIRGKWYTDTMFSSVKAHRMQYNCAQVYTNGSGFDAVYPMNSKSGDATAHTLTSFVQDFGIPQKLISDDAKELIQGEFHQRVLRFQIDHKWIVPYSPWRNLTEQAIRELKKGVRSDTRRSRSPAAIWDYCLRRRAAIRRLTASSILRLEGRTPFESVEGSTPDISAYCLFDWYEPVYYHTPTKGFPYQKLTLGRWIGVADDVCTDILASYILTGTGEILIRKSVWRPKLEEKETPEYTKALEELDADITDNLGGYETAPAVPATDKSGKNPYDPIEGYEPEKDLFAEGDDDYTTVPMDIKEEAPEADDYTPEETDRYLHAKVLLPRGGEFKMGEIKARKRDLRGLPIGKEDPNPILDTREYVVEFPDGSTDTYLANVIAENLYSQVDEEGRTFQVLSEISDYRRKPGAIPKDSPLAWNDSVSGNRVPTPTTKGWELKVEWKDGSSSWVPLKDLKESNPVEVAEFAVSSKIADEPAFRWWVQKVLRRRERIIKKVKSRYWSRTHKFGIELPKSVKEALAIDRRTGTTFWKNAIEKEMRNVAPAFKFVDDDKVPPFYKAILCHMVFDIRMGTLERKARFVAGGHMTDEPTESVYSSVVSRDTVRLAFLLAALNDVDILVGDVQNAYLNADTSEKIYIKSAGPEFGPNQGRPVIIVRALYGLKSSGKMWRQDLAATLQQCGYTRCRADGDLWMRKARKPAAEGDTYQYEYWEYVLVYVDDILVVSHDPRKTMTLLESRYTLKPSSIKEPDKYLGADIRKWYIDDTEDPDKTRWAMSSDSYVKTAIGEVERELEKVGQALPKRAETPLTQGYRPEVDSSAELDDEKANYYQGLIGVLRWICELGRIDILLPVSLLSRFMAAPREGHLAQVFHVFAYLKKHNRSAIVFDDTYPTFDESRFTKVDWSDDYPDAAEAVPHDAPEPRGAPVTTTCFVDADHAGCLRTRRSHTGVLIFVNRAPILWFSKRQNTVESSTFGSEFVALKVATEMIEGLRYKLRMMGVPFEGPTDVFCDNESVVKNVSRPESVLKKKHNAIAYHRCRESQAAGTTRIAWEDGKYNLADLLTKPLAGPRLKALVSRILW